MRDRFTRLSQMAIVLCLDDPAEIWEYKWGDKVGQAVVKKWSNSGQKMAIVLCLDDPAEIWEYKWGDKVGQAVVKSVVKGGRTVVKKWSKVVKKWSKSGKDM